MKKFILLFITLTLFFSVSKNVRAGTVSYPQETNILISDPNITLVVSANSSADSVVVTGTSVTVTVTAPDTFTIRSNSGYLLANDLGLVATCSDSVSTLVIRPGSGTQTVTITPNTQVCTTSVPGPGPAPSCGDQAPGPTAPWLYSAVKQSNNSVLLYFTKAADPVNKYALEYGTKPGNYIYGVADLGISLQEKMTFQVNALAPNTTYYFRVRGGNGCATGPWSNEISVKIGEIISVNELEVTQSELVPSLETSQGIDACQTYIVKSGDTLKSIAENVYGDENKYVDIINLNKDKYTSLESADFVVAGWELKVNCAETKRSVGYNLRVKVVDTNKKPVEGARVTIHSDVKDGLTNKDGIAKFWNIDPGEHRVLISYNNYEGEQTINLTGDDEEYDLNVTIELKAVSWSPNTFIIIGLGVITTIVVLIGLLYGFRLFKRSREDLSKANETVANELK